MPGPAADQGRAADDQAHVQAIASGAGSSFFWAMRLLPRARRDAMFALYAYCRAIDDIADDPQPVADKLHGLDAWRGRIGALYQGTPTHPVMRALARPVADYGLERADFERLIDGMEMDARGPIVAPPLKALEVYCDCVAGAVGRLSVRIFGLSGAASRQLAYSLGQALQLTNVLRDVSEDAAMGRLYLPAELLARHGVRVGSPEAALADPGIDAACRDLGELARGRFAEARAALDGLPRRSARPAIVMMEVYQRLLHRLCRRGWSDHMTPVRLSRAEKLWVAVRHGLL